MTTTPTTTESPAAPAPAPRVYESDPKAFDVTVAQQALLRALDKAVPVAQRKSAMPALACVLLEARDHRLRFGTTDLYQFVDGTIPAEIAAAESIAVDAKMLRERVAVMPPGPVRLRIRGGYALIESVGHARRFEVPMLPGREMPLFPRPNGEPGFRIGAGVLALVIEAVIASVADDETRPHVNSALVESDRVLRFVSTDGHRLQRVEVELPQGAKPVPEGALLPKAALHVLHKLAGGEADRSKDAEAAVWFEGPHVFIEVASVLHAVKLVSARFPPWRQVLPAQSGKRTIVAGREKLATLARGVAIAADQKRAIRVHLDPGRLRLVADSPEQGDASDEMDVSYAGPSMTLGVDARYLCQMLDGLARFETEEVTLDIDSELDPMLLRARGDDRYLGVLMPMRV